MAKAETERRLRLRLEWIEAGSLAENPRNWMRHPDGQMAALKDVINDPEVGWAGACLWNERTQRLIDGHARRNAVDPSTPIPVLIGSWSEDAEKKILLTLDPLGALATPDPEALRALLDSVSLDTDALKAMGDGLAAQLEAMNPIPEPVTAPMEFGSYDESIDTQYRCPKCGYEWSGKPK